MEVSAVRSAVLRDRNFSSTESSGSKGPLWSPARMIERSQEGTRGGLEGFILLAPFRNLTMRSCFPRDRPSTASWWAAIAATYTFKVEGDSLRSNLSCRKESTTPIVHLRGSSRWEEKRNSYRFGMTWGWVIDGKVLFLGGISQYPFYWIKLWSVLTLWRITIDTFTISSPLFQKLISLFMTKGESHFSVLPLTLRLTPSPCPSKPSGKR